MPDCLKITGGLTFKHDSEKLDIFLKSIILDYFRPIFEEKWVGDPGSFGGNRGVEIDRNAIRN